MKPAESQLQHVPVTKRFRNSPHSPTHTYRIPIRSSIYLTASQKPPHPDPNRWGWTKMARSTRKLTITQNDTPVRADLFCLSYSYKSLQNTLISTSTPFLSRKPNPTEQILGRLSFRYESATDGGVDLRDPHASY